MISNIEYDGSTPLRPVVARVCGFSEKNRTKCAAIIHDAKESLAIPDRSDGKFTPDERVRIYRWIYDNKRTSDGSVTNGHAPVDLFGCVDSFMELFAQTAVQSNVLDDVSAEFELPSSHDERAQIDVHPMVDGFTQNIVQHVDCDPPLLAQQTVQPTALDIVQSTALYLVRDFRPRLFTVKIQRGGKSVRTSIELDEYIVDALRRKHGLADNSVVRQWIEAEIRADEAFNDGGFSVAKQVRRLAVQSLIT